MLENSNLEAIKAVAIEFLNMPSVQTSSVGDIPLFSHPFLPMLQTGDVDEIKKYIEKKLMRYTDYLDMLMLINGVFRPKFFAQTQEYLSLEDFSKGLAYVWVKVEFPNINKDISVSQFIDLFNKADKKYLMDTEELETFNTLPEEIEIYRGINQYGSVMALSWTIEESIADSFAERNGGEQALYKAKVKKADVLAYFSRESEVVVDISKVYDIKQLY